METPGFWLSVYMSQLFCHPLPFNLGFHSSFLFIFCLQAAFNWILSCVYADNLCLFFLLTGTFGLTVIISFSIAVIKFCEKSNLGEKGFILAAQGYSLSWGEWGGSSWQQRGTQHTPFPLMKFDIDLNFKKDLFIFNKCVCECMYTYVCSHHTHFCEQNRL